LPILVTILLTDKMLKEYKHDPTFKYCYNQLRKQSSFFVIILSLFLSSVGSFIVFKLLIIYCAEVVFKTYNIPLIMVGYILLQATKALRESRGIALLCF
jgi:hypothetical protein